MIGPRLKRGLTLGIGVNDSDYVTLVQEQYTDSLGNTVRELTWSCPFYGRWKTMLHRCYSEKQLNRFPTYRGCSVCDEWLTFSKFKAWMEQQDWEGKYLDKDLLVRGNKVYSPETCVFVSSRVNGFLHERDATNSLPVGVSLKKSTGKYVAYCNSAEGERVHLGYFHTVSGASEAWLDYKLKQAKILAAEQDDIRVADALIERYENYEWRETNFDQEKSGTS